MIMTDMTVRAFSEKLASNAPAPGGGSAAALSGALGAALISMVCRLTQGKEKYAEFESLVMDTIPKSDELMNALLDGIQKDTNAFDGVIAAFGLPKGTDAEKAARSIPFESVISGVFESGSADEMVDSPPLKSKCICVFRRPFKRGVLNQIGRASCRERV